MSPSVPNILAEHRSELAMSERRRAHEVACQLLAGRRPGWVAHPQAIGDDGVVCAVDRGKADPDSAYAWITMTPEPFLVLIFRPEDDGEPLSSEAVAEDDLEEHVFSELARAERGRTPRMSLMPEGIPDHLGAARYWPIEADGQAYVTYGGYVQRPAAIEYGKKTGYGMWDRVDQTWLSPIDFEKRIQFYEGRIVDWREAIKREDERIAGFRALQAAQQAQAGERA
ncbi:MAG: hypothetical protein ACTHNP_01895 [Solirubrobacterales bacterium]